MTMLIAVTVVFALLVGGRQLVQSALRFLVGLVVLVVLLVMIASELLARSHELLQRADETRVEAARFWDSLPSPGTGALVAACLAVVLFAVWFRRRGSSAAGELERTRERERRRMPPSGEENW